MQELSPNYHTIADFRKSHPTALKNLFKLYVQFLAELNLLGKQTIGIDGSKFRAVNSRKNNYNQKKIDKHHAMVDEKAEQQSQPTAVLYVQASSFCWALH